MGRNPKISSKQKLWAINRILNGQDSILHTTTLLGCSDVSIHEWILNYQSNGIDGLVDKRGKNTLTLMIRLELRRFLLFYLST